VIDTKVGGAIEEVAGSEAQPEAKKIIDKITT